MTQTDYSEDVHAEAESHPTLGGEYFEARNIAREFMAHWTEEHAAQLAEAIVKPAVDAIYEKALDAFQDWLLINAEDNLQGAMRGMVEQTVNALLGGRKWANVKYLESPYEDGQKIRAALAKLHPDQIKDARIADLEAQVEKLRKDIEWYRER